MSFNLSKQKKLLKSVQFQAVFDSPDFKLSSKYLLILAKRNQQQHARLGLVIGKKNINLAVNRNKVKRHIRESFRLHQNNLPCVDLLFIARRGLGDLPNTELRQELARQWQRLNKKCSAQEQ